MHAFLRFPGNRRRALTLSYDDGVIFDKRLVEILNENGIKCTFNLNSGFYGNGPRRLTREDAVALFKNSGHEVALHGEHHYSLAEVDTASAVRDIMNDRADHERTYGTIVRGLAYANGSYNDEVVNLLRTCGVAYARTVSSTEKFDIPTDFLRWHPTAHHGNKNLMALCDKFLDAPNERWIWQKRPRLFYLWGHSYEFNDNDNWEIIEEFAKKMGGHEEVWYATNMEVYEYVTAFNNLVYSYDGKTVYNPSATDVWLCRFGKDLFVPAGKTVILEEIGQQ